MPSHGSKISIYTNYGQIGRGSAISTHLQRCSKELLVDVQQYDSLAAPYYALHLSTSHQPATYLRTSLQVERILLFSVQRHKLSTI